SAPVAAGGEDGHVRAEAVQRALVKIERHHAAARAILHFQRAGRRHLAPIAGLRVPQPGVLLEVETVQPGISAPLPKGPKSPFRRNFLIAAGTTSDPEPWRCLVASQQVN